MAFRIHIGTCANIFCKKENVLIPVKSGVCVYCNEAKKKADKRAAGKVSKVKVNGPTGEKDVFHAVLDNLPDEITRCFVCRKRIAVVTHNNFAHVLPKGKYPKFRLNPDNLVLLCHRMVAVDGDPGCHFSYDMTPHSELKGEGWERLFALRDKLKEEYKRHES